MLTYYSIGVVGLLVHLQSAKSPVHLILSDFQPRWQLFSIILKVALLSSLQILVSNVALIAITAYVAHFGIEALAGYGLAARVELLISSMVLALGVGTTIMVGTCVGARLEARASRDAYFVLAGGGYFCGNRFKCCVLRQFDCRSFHTCRRGCPCGIRLFLRDWIGLRLHGRLCHNVLCLSGLGASGAPAACQPDESCYRADRGMDAAAICASPRLAILSCCGFHGYWSIGVGCRFRAPAAKSRVLMLSG